MARGAVSRWGFLATAWAIMLALVGPAQLNSQELLRYSLQQPPSTTPIQVAADEITEYLEGRWKYVRLLGHVLIDQGGGQRLRADRAIARIEALPDLPTRSVRVEVYAEGRVTVEEQGKPRKAERACVEFRTTAPIEVQSSTKQVDSLVNDPFLQRAQKVWSGQQSDTVLTSGSEPALPSLPGPTSTSPPPSIPGLPHIPVTPTGPDNIFTPPVQSPAPPRILRIAPRTGKRFEMETLAEHNAILVTGGIILQISNVDRLGILDIEADNLIIWARGDANQFWRNLQSGQGETSQESEFYLSGNVVLRAGREGEQRVLRADELYYDVSRNVAIAVAADLELLDPRLPDAVHFRADELYQLGPSDFKAIRAEVFSSRLPSDPGLTVFMGAARLRQRRVPRVNIFGRPFLDRESGEPEIITEQYFQGENVQLRLAGLPIVRTGFVQGSITNPSGPIRGVTFRRDRVFGYHLGGEFDMFNLLGINPPAGHRWTLGADWFTKRGPGLGTNFEYAGRELLGFHGPHTGLFKAYGVYDEGIDILGGPRIGAPHPRWRGRIFWRHMQDFGQGWQLMTQTSLLSDRNFLEQYYKPEFDLEPNQETFVHLNKQEDFWGGSLLVKPRLRDWVTETAWLPKVEGRVVGWTPWDLLTYNARASLGYAQLRPANVPPFATLPTDVNRNLGRFDFWQDVSLPVMLGPIKVVPFATMDVAAYTNGVDHQAHGRFYIGGGARASLPLSRLDPDVRSDLLNLQGLYHKAVFRGTYYAAWTGTPYSVLPQLDRLHDDATDQALRDITPLQPILNPAHGAALASSPVYNPQLYAIRRLVDSYADTLDKIQVFQLDLRQRWQTKRGFPGMQHTVDVLTFDVSTSLFPNATRDNFGSAVGFVEYDMIWNAGDRTSVVSSGWFDPFALGTKYINVGLNLNRPDGTLFQFGYRHIDPIDCRLLLAGASYVFSPKYSMSAATGFDFGNNRGLYNTLSFTRSGTDLQLTVGITYNPLVNNFGFHVSLLPILVAQQRQNSRALPGLAPLQLQ